MHVDNSAHATLLNMADSPKAFISHASEDKDRFVLDFGRALRSQGVDAWLDKWEIAPGDSLVDRIFSEGIATADALLIVLSSISVTKPWVREELDAAVVRRVEDKTRLIPIILDKEVAVPAALRHLLYVSVPKLGFDGAVAEVVRVLHGGELRPALGAPPAYATRGRTAVAEDPVDDVVFNCIRREIGHLSPRGLIVHSNEVQARAAELGVTAEAFFESLHELKRKGLIAGVPMAGGKRWSRLDIPAGVWLRIHEAEGVNTRALRDDILSFAVNHGARRVRENDFAYPPRTLYAVLDDMQLRGLVKHTLYANRDIWISEGTPLARRTLRSG